MKKFLLITSVAATNVLLAQSPRLSLYEFFTGENNPIVVSTNTYVNPMLASSTNTAKVVALNWEVPIPSAPALNWSIYQSYKADIDWRYKPASAGGYGYQTQSTSSSSIYQGIIQSPYGLLDGQQQWTFGATGSHPNFLNNSVIAAAQSFTSPFSVSITRAWDATFSAVNVTIVILATASFTASGNLVFRTVMVERHIHFDSAPGTNGERDFENVPIGGFPTMQGGTAMAAGWVNGQTQTITLNCPLPLTIRDKAEVMFVGFIQDDGNKKVIQAAKTSTAPVTDDVKIVSVSMHSLSCTTSIMSPTFVVANIGTSTVTSFDYSAYLNGVAKPAVTWTGNLAPGASLTIIPAPLTNTANVSGTNTLSYLIGNVSGGDDNGLNNYASTTYSIENDAPFIYASASSNTGCAGTAYTITPYLAVTYTLFPGSVAGIVFTVTPLGNTIYTVTGSDSQGCVAANTITISINIPAPVISLTVSNGVLCAGNSATVGASGAENYTLNPGGQTGSSFTISPTGTTFYTVTASSGSLACKTTSAFTQNVDPCLSVTSQNEGWTNVYPIPATDHLTIERRLAAPANLSITDNLGRVIVTGTLSTRSTDVDLSDVRPGVYYLFISGDEPAHWKILKE
jgi:hypothetical protein